MRDLTKSSRRTMKTAVFSLVLAAFTSACGGGGDATPTTPVVNTPVVASVAVSLASNSLVVGQSTSATAEAKTAAGVVLSRAITWSSSASIVASVDASGRVTAVSAGTATILATADGISGSAALTVTPVPIASLVMSTDSTNIALRATGTLSATARDAAGQALTGRTITWTSSAPTVASVTSEGVVTMLRPGTVTITASSEGKSATARVRGTVADLSALVDSIRRATGVPAIGAAIVTTDGLIGTGVGGNRRASGGQPVTINDTWHLGSDTKAITAMLAGMAVDAGVLSWDRTIEQAFPDLASVTRAEYKTVTLRELFSHLSGLVNSNTGLTGSTNYSAARTAWMNVTFQQAPNNPRGQFYYSNNGYGAAGAMIERAWGSSYETLISTKIWQPLGVVGAGWGPTTVAGGQDQPVGHSRVNNAWVACEACDNPPGLSSAGTMHIPLAGWARIIQELLLADQGRSSLLTQATARVLTSNGVPTGGGSPYAMGWVVSNGPNGRVISHDGSNTTNHARATVFLDGGIAFLVAINATDGPGGITSGAMGSVTTRLSSYFNTGR